MIFWDDQYSQNDKFSFDNLSLFWNILNVLFASVYYTILPMVRQTNSPIPLYLKCVSSKVKVIRTCQLWPNTPSTDDWNILIPNDFYSIGKQKVPLRKPFLQNFGTNCREYVSFITMILMSSNISHTLSILHIISTNNSSLCVIMITIFINPLSSVALGDCVISNWRNNIIILISCRLLG